MDPRAVIASLVEDADARHRRHARPAATSASSSAARCPPRSPPTGSRRSGTRTPASTSAGPSAAVVEEVCRRWLAELLGLPPDVSVAYVTGCQMAHVTALAAARHHVLAQAGLGRRAATGSPARRRSASSSARSAMSTIDRALRLLGIGASRSRSCRPTTRAACASTSSGSTTARRSSARQAGEVNTGAFDDLDAIADVVAGSAAPGSTSTAPSGSGRRPRRSCATSCAAPSAPTRGRPTATSG